MKITFKFLVVTTQRAFFFMWKTARLFRALSASKDSKEKVTKHSLTNAVSICSCVFKDLHGEDECENGGEREGASTVCTLVINNRYFSYTVLDFRVR